jgi:GAF domain-containing protein
MVIVAIAASLAAGIVAASTVINRRARLQSRRRLETVIQELDEGLGGIAAALARALERSEKGVEARGAGLGLTLDLDELLLSLAKEAPARAGAQAAAVRVSGPGDAPAVGYFGAEEAAQLLEATLRPPDRRPFRALTINWSFPTSLDAEPDTFRSALVVPVVEDGLETGAIAAYARESAAFRPEHTRALETLAVEAAEGIATARRFTAMKLRAANSRREKASRSRESDASAWRGELQRAGEPGDART